MSLDPYHRAEHIYFRAMATRHFYVDASDHPHAHIHTVTIEVQDDEFQNVLFWCDERLNGDFIWRQHYYNSKFTFYFMGPKNATLFALTWGCE